MKVVHVGIHIDHERRRPKELLRAWPTLTDLAVAVSRAGAAVRVLQVAGEDATLDSGGVACEFVAERVVRFRGRDLMVPRRLGRRLADLRPDVVHIHGLAHPLRVRWLQRRIRGTPVLMQDHSSRAPRGWRVPLYRWGLANIDAVSFTAPSMAAPFQRAGCWRSDLPVFGVVESSSWFTPGDQADAREKTGLAGDPCLLCVGRLIRDKDPGTLLEAVRLAARRLPELRLWWCYSESPLLTEVKARIAADPELGSRVHLMGRVPHDQIQDVYRSADFFVLPSRREGSGYALIEALASGVTPVVSDIPAFREITGDGAVGALAPVGDARALAQGIVRLAAADRAGLRAKARAHFERRLSFDVLGAQLVAAYATLVGS